ncbi:MAG: hypothetical protein IK019_09950, partial [Clostridia bacterium]|nr:hypothetical protein [Clostridia bacterium]
MNEMCAAGGGDPKPYRLRFPFDPDEMVGGRCESLISHNLSFASVNNSVVAYPVFAVPEQHIRHYVLYRHKSLIREHRLAFSDARQLGYFSLLPEMPVYAVLFDRDLEHLAGALAVDIASAGEHIQAPPFSRQPRYDSRFDRAEVGDDEP